MRLQRAIRRLAFRDFELLSAVATQASLSKAAVRLNITQSGVSRAIARLEDALGVALVERSAQGVELTPYGRALIKTGEAVFAELRHGIAAIENLADPDHGELRIGCTEPMAWGIVPTIIHRLTQRHPRFRFHIVHGDPEILRRRDLPEHRVDLVIGAVTGVAPEEAVDVETLCDEPRFIVASATSSLARRRKLTLSDVAEAIWAIAPDESPARQTLEAAFRTEGLSPPRYAVETFSIPLLATLVSAGECLTVLPNSMLRFSAHRFAMKKLPIALPSHHGRIGIMTLKRRTDSPIVRAFKGEARTVARSPA